MKDRDFLIWIHQRLVVKHGESEIVDYMHKLRAVITAIPAEQETPCGCGGNNIEQLRRRLHLPQFEAPVVFHGKRRLYAGRGKIAGKKGGRS